MHVQHHHLPGGPLGRPMEVREFGDRGQPVVVFPSQDGHAGDFEGFGMIHACAPLLEAGRVRFFVVDGNDWESWTNQAVPPAARARRHQDYDRWITEEVVPFARARSGRAALWAAGCSMGAYHAANALFRHPDAFDGLIGLSGLYDVTMFVGDFVNDDVYFNAPLRSLPGLADPWYLARLRASRIAVLVGQGAHEEECLRDTRALDATLAALRIPAWFDYWGHDVNHDWPWWRRMLPYALERLGV
jgi:esterase/lipase superfamily enzyme